MKFDFKREILKNVKPGDVLVGMDSIGDKQTVMVINCLQEGCGFAIMRLSDGYVLKKTFSLTISEAIEKYDSIFGHKVIQHIKNDNIVMSLVEGE